MGHDPLSDVSKLIDDVKGRPGVAKVLNEPALHRRSAPRFPGRSLAPVPPPPSGSLIGNRAVAHVIDALAMSAFGGLIAFFAGFGSAAAAGWLVARGPAVHPAFVTMQIEWVSTHVEYVASACGSLLGLLGVLLFVGVYGQTPGKRLLHIHVLDETAHAVALRSLAMRREGLKWGFTYTLALVGECIDLVQSAELASLSGAGVAVRIATSAWGIGVILPICGKLGVHERLSRTRVGDARDQAVAAAGSAFEVVLPANAASTSFAADASPSTPDSRPA